MARTPITQKVTRRRAVKKKNASSTKRSKLESSKSKSKSSTKILDDHWDEKIRAHRERQASVSAILNQTFSQHGKNNPDLWERKAYLMLVGLVYEKLATREDELSTNELVALAKVLAENRRVEVRSRSNPGEHYGDQNHRNHTGKLPEGIVDTVRQLYGVDLQIPTRNGKDMSIEE